MKPPRYLTTSIWEAGEVAEAFPLNLGGYVRDERIGGGGMGEVYRYRGEWIGQFVAIKAVRAEYWSRPRARERFRREAQALLALSNSDNDGARNVGAFLHHIEHEGRIYIVLEYVGGESLAEVLANRSLTIERALGLGVQLGRALAAGHELNIVHRDVKPDNIKLTTGGRLRLLDYGLAWLRASAFMDVDPEAETVVDSEAVTRGLTRDGHVIGTYGYMSPEQTYGRATDHRTDIWAFGCVLFECLTGRCAFDGPTNEAIVDATRDDDPPFEAMINVPDAVQTLVRSCLAKRPEDRPSSMRDVCAVLLSARATGAAVPSLPVPQNLPVEPEPFIGREQDLAELRDLSTRSRLVTLTGMGGAGKTRLALEFARRCLLPEDDWMGVLPYPDGVFFVKLGDVKSDRRVPQAVAAAVRGERGQPPRGRSVTDAIVEELKGRRVLLVLDGCEHVRSACVKLIRRLDACPAVQVIATSQVPLDRTRQTVREKRRRIAGLTFPPADAPPECIRDFDAVRLFCQAVPGFDLDHRNRDAVARICRRLEGHPLAIKLAANAAEDGDVRDLEQHLGELSDLKSVLHASIDWSATLLDDAERRLLGRLAVFRGGWTLDAAKAVCAGDGLEGRSVFDILRGLQRKSFVVFEEHEDRSRYHLLEVVAWYCREQEALHAEVDAALRHQHLLYYLDLAERAHTRLTGDERLEGHELAAWMNRLESELGNLRAAWCTSVDGSPDHSGQLARALQPFWYVRNYLDEGRAALEDAIRRRGDACDPLQSQLFNAVGILATRQSDYDDASRYFERSIAIGRAVRAGGDDTGLCLAGPLTNLGMVRQEQGDLVEARALHGEAIAIYEALDETSRLANVQLNLAVVAKREGAYEDGRRLLAAALPVFRDREDTQRIGATLRNLGEIAQDERRDDLALTYLRDSLTTVAPLKDRHEVSELLQTLSRVYARTGAVDKAGRLLGASTTMNNTRGSSSNGAGPATLEREVTSTLEASDKSKFKAGFEAGKQLSYDEAIEEGRAQ